MSLALLLASPLIAQADENYFGYTYGSDTLPAGGNEAYLWLTQRTGKGEGHYRADDVELEYEHGWTDRFQTSFYLTGRAYDYSGGAVVDEATAAPVALHRGLDFDGVKVEMKWNLKSPERNGYGLALYLEPEYSSLHRPDGERFKELALEGKLILQKDFLDGQWVTAYNLSLEPEWERESGGDWQPELVVGNSAAVAYRFAPRWFVGLETRVDMAFPDYGAREYWAWFAGPSLHYAAQRWWTTLTWMPQIKGGPTEAERSTRLHLEQAEKSEVRLKLGVNF
ncbi:MAG: DUF6662 family protein [Luteimonas sp.]